MLVLFVVFLLLGVKAVNAAPGNQQIVENAVLVSDGQVLPENKGKVVIVQGTMSVEDLKAFTESSSKSALAGSIGFALVLAAIGVLMIVRSGKHPAVRRGKR